jgi:hypothetical protein
VCERVRGVWVEEESWVLISAVCDSAIVRHGQFLRGSGRGL